MAELRKEKGPLADVWRLLVSTIILFASFLPPFSAPARARTVRIGVLAFRGAASAREKWRPTADYLSGRLRYRFEIVPLDFRQIGPAVKRHDVDFLIANPSIYVEMENRYGISRIATLKNLTPGNKGITVFGGVIFCRAGSGIKNLGDLRGKSFMGVDRASLGGWRMALLELGKKGINPYRDFSRLGFAGTQDAVVYAVRRGQADAGTVRTDVLERMSAKGVVRLGDFRVLDRRRYKHFPYLASTPLYPEWPFAKLRQTPDALSRQVALALFEMPAGSPAALRAGIAGWTVPLDYSPVLDLLKTLRMSPYRGYGKISMAGALRQYGLLLLLLSAALGFIIATIVYMIKLNRKLRQSGLVLEAAKEDLERKVTARTEELEALNRNLRQEISERRQMEGAHQDHIRFLQTLIDAIPAPVFYKNAQGVYLGCNRAFEELAGLGRDGIIGKSVHEVSPDNLAGLHSEADAGLGDSLGARTSESSLIYADGSRHEVIVYKAAFHNSGGGASSGAGMVGTILDITEHKGLEDALRESEGRFRAMIESEPQCVKLLDREGNMLAMNPAGLAMIEADSLEQVKGTKVFNLVVPEYRPAFRQLMDKVFIGEPGTLEFEITGLRGTNRKITTHAVPFRNAKGEITALLCI
ncbi:MAG: PhnD/SsuA/transferrin family substrate-binding protein, partial [Nitrospiraceae bacterium]|nr:PhnD/SsuA/transferrin family substrate-binding protein [Nitrospiraceae bacterium]